MYKDIYDRNLFTINKKSDNIKEGLSKIDKASQDVAQMQVPIINILLLTDLCKVQSPLHFGYKIMLFSKFKQFVHTYRAPRGVLQI